jgi:hypothetical protein
MEGDQTIVEIGARNVSDKAVYVCETPATPREKEVNRKGPYVFYGGNHTVVLYWATTAYSEDVEFKLESRPGASVRRVEPGATITLRAALSSVFDGVWPWRETIYCDHDAFFQRRDSQDRRVQLSYRVDRVLVMVAYWEEAPLMWRRGGRVVVCAEPDGTYYFSQDYLVPLAILPPASYRTVVAQRALLLEALNPFAVPLKDVEILAQVGPIALPKPLTIQYMGARWSEEDEQPLHERKHSESANPAPRAP